ncbi:uncharacterized protein VTP21DRAFT_3474 [Calcarisporiella thermophila]|uniref:uncharacterized protein n=1 Tax=Calcarisporiella thermophila TaxID=911321 RepID=UPI003742D8A4
MMSDRSLDEAYLSSADGNYRHQADSLATDHESSFRVNPGNNNFPFHHRMTHVEDHGPLVSVDESQLRQEFKNYLDVEVGSPERMLKELRQNHTRHFQHKGNVSPSNLQRSQSVDDSFQNNYSIEITNGNQTYRRSASASTSPTSAAIPQCPLTLKPTPYRGGGGGYGRREYREITGDESFVDEEGEESRVHRKIETQRSGLSPTPPHKQSYRPQVNREEEEVKGQYRSQRLTEVASTPLREGQRPFAVNENHIVEDSAMRSLSESTGSDKEPTAANADRSYIPLPQDRDALMQALKNLMAELAHLRREKEFTDERQRKLLDELEYYRNLFAKQQREQQSSYNSPPVPAPESASKAEERHHTMHTEPSDGRVQPHRGPDSGVGSSSLEENGHAFGKDSLEGLLHRIRELEEEREHLLRRIQDLEQQVQFQRHVARELATERDAQQNVVGFLEEKLQTLEANMTRMEGRTRFQDKSIEEEEERQKDRYIPMETSEITDDRMEVKISPPPERKEWREPPREDDRERAEIESLGGSLDGSMRSFIGDDEVRMLQKEIKRERARRKLLQTLEKERAERLRLETEEKQRQKMSEEEKMYESESEDWPQHRRHVHNETREAIKVHDTIFGKKREDEEAEETKMDFEPVWKHPRSHRSHVRKPVGSGTRGGNVKNIFGREMPFLPAGQLSGKSHSLTANLNRMLAMLKSHNPALCTICNRKKAKFAKKRRPIAPDMISREEDEPVLDRIISEMEDELQHLRLRYHALIHEYDELFHDAERQANEDAKEMVRELKDIMEGLELKEEQVAALKEVRARRRKSMKGGKIERAGGATSTREEAAQLLRGTRKIMEALKNG